MRFWPVMVILLAVVASSCLRQKEKESLSEVQIYGHRGYAGKYPENSLRAFEEALELDLDGLELDVVISKDGQVVVSHEPYMASDYMLDPSGRRIPHEEELNHNLYQLTYEQIKTYDAGAGKNKRYPDQERVPGPKPLLSEVIDLVKAKASGEDMPLLLIEIKSEERFYGSYQPLPGELVDLVLEVIDRKKVLPSTVIQSFDPQVLNQLHKKRPEAVLSFLVSEGSFDSNLSRLSFLPDFYSPNKDLVSAELIDNASKKKIGVIPWTVNSEKTAQEFASLGVHGIITDFPERLLP